MSSSSSSNADWSYDFCLSCDNQTSEGPYCSQTCRMADLAKGPSIPYQPSRTDSSSSTTSSASGSFSSTHSAGSAGFYMSPSFDWSNQSRRGSEPVYESHTSSAIDISYDYISASRTSLDYLGSTPTQLRGPRLSASAKEELKHYDNSFDTRRRRKNSRNA